MVDNLYVRRSLCHPAKTNTILIIDLNAELPFAISFERFEPIPWRGPQEIQGFSCVQLRQLPCCDLSDRRKPSALSRFEQGPRFWATKAFDHMRTI
jgi:hypothetical protein